MRKWAALAFATVFTAGCGGSVEMPRPGDEVKPGLTRKIEWKAGQKNELWVDLQAKAPGGAPRRLDFKASQGKNPIATISFYDADGNLVGGTPQTVELSVRC